MSGNINLATVLLVKFSSDYWSSVNQQPNEYQSANILATQQFIIIHVSKQVRITCCKLLWNSADVLHFKTVFLIFYSVFKTEC